MVKETRNMDYKNKKMDVDRDGNLYMRATKKLRLAEGAPRQELKRSVDEDGELLEHTIIISAPENEDELDYFKEQMVNFNKYCTLNKMKDEVRKEIDILDQEKRTFMIKYENGRKAAWRKFYKYKEEAERLEQEMNKVKDNMFDPDMERKLKIELDENNNQ